MEKTPFAGYTELDPGESLSTDGFSFQSINPQIADFFAKLTLTHRHTGEAAMAAPTDPLVATLVGSGGTIPSDVDLFYVYTLLDDVGGETLASPPVHLATPGPIPPPASGPTLALDYTAGVLTVGTYYYVLTYVDADGHETTASPYSAAVREPGHANARVMFSGLNTFPTGAVGWRLYKSTANAPYRLVGTGAGATFIDDGNVCADCVGTPPTVNRTGSTSEVSITKPTLPADATGFRIYVSTTGSFANPALVGSYAPSVADPIVVTDLNPDPGVPPTVPTAVGGASLIDPDTELIDFHWKRAVANAATLPGAGNSTGDVRLTLDDFIAHVWDGAAWRPFTGGFEWKAPVADLAALPGSGNTTGDVRVTLDDFAGHIWNGAAWQAFGGGGGGGSGQWLAAVADAGSLPGSGNTRGDVRVTLDTLTAYIWDETVPAWKAIKSKPDAWTNLHLHDPAVDGGVNIKFFNYGAYAGVWGPNPASPTPGFYKSPDGIVRLRGTVYAAAVVGTYSASGDKPIIAHLPAECFPASVVSCLAWCTTASEGKVLVIIIVDTGGLVSIGSYIENGTFAGAFDASTKFSLDSIEFRAA